MNKSSNLKYQIPKCPYCGLELIDGECALHGYVGDDVLDYGLITKAWVIQGGLVGLGKAQGFWLGNSISISV